MCSVNSAIVLRQIRINITKNSPINSDTEAQKALGTIMDSTISGLCPKPLAVMRTEGHEGESPCIRMIAVYIR